MNRLFGSAWASCFSVSALVVLLQAIPGIGFFLSFFNPSRWSILLVNLGFILMALEGFGRSERRVLKVVPVLWFGVYVAAAGLSHVLAAQFYAQLDRENMSQKITWDRSTDAVILSHSWSDENRAVSFTAEKLIMNYPLDSAYEGPVTGAQDGPSGYRQFKIGIGDCPRGSMNQGPDGTRVTRNFGTEIRFADRLCVNKTEASTPSSMIRFVNSDRVSKDLLLDREIEPIAVSTSAGRSYRLRAGWTRPLTWYPGPIIGCEWPGYTPKPTWCGIKFARESARENGRTPEKVITAALGLNKVGLEERFKDIAWK